MLGKPCLPFSGRIASDGYGRSKNGVLAHRVAYCAAHGLQLSDILGLVIRHRCDNRCCVEPEPLEPGTHEDNMADMGLRGRSNRGARHGMAKLSAGAVVAIRATYVPYSKTAGIPALSRRFGISKSQIGRILRGQRWQQGTDSLSH